MEPLGISPQPPAEGGGEPPPLMPRGTLACIRMQKQNLMVHVAICIF